MYRIEIPNTVHQLMRIFYRLGLWSDDDGKNRRKIYCFVYFVSFVLSIVLGAYITDNKDECVFLIVVAVAVGIHSYRLWIILWRKKELLMLLDQICTHSTYDRNEFIRINEKLNVLVKCIRCFLLFVTTGVFSAAVVYPITSDKQLIFNIAFPLDRNKSDIVFLMASGFIFGGVFFSVLCTILTSMTWFVMLNLSFKYKLLGNQLTYMGTIRTGNPNLKVSLVAQHQLFIKDLMMASRAYDKINGALEDFASLFTNLFSMQIATGSVCICGSVYTLAFSSHCNLIQDGFYCVTLGYSIFDIFTIMYFGNEIMLCSDGLTRCVYQSQWIEQPQSCKRCIIILTERLKRPQELIVGKIYRLNLLTFTKIVNGAYSIFNILQKLR